MGNVQRPLFRLANYQSNQGPRAGIVIGGKIIDLYRAVGHFEAKAGKKIVRSATFDSIMDILKGWQEFKDFLTGVAKFLYDDF